MKLKKNELTELAEINHERTQLLLRHNDFYIREAYKSLRTNVMFSLTDENKCHVIMVTSSLPREGKSTISANLAISLAEDGKRTLLIDCDMRKPQIARLLKIHNASGLSDMLFSSSDNIGPQFFRINDMDLFVLTAGSIPPNPSELLGSIRMKKLIDSLRRKFDYIILDMPPINIVTDAVVASSLTDGALMVIRSGKTERNAVLRAMDQLERANAKILGVVLTRVNHRITPYGRSKEYGYGYSYSETPTARK